MTLATALFGSRGLPYPSGVPQIVKPINSLVVTPSVINTDIMQGFLARADVTIDAVWWNRTGVTASNVYVGIYSAAGTLLTDCAVDSDTTAGLHEVSTTPVLLSAGQLYYWCANQSAAAITGDQVGSTDVEVSALLTQSIDAIDLRMVSTSFGAGRAFAASLTKSRTNAALLSTQTMSGWTPQPNLNAFLGGFVPT